MPSAVLADRSKQHPGNLPAHGEQVGAMCRVEQHAGRVAVYDTQPAGNRAARWALSTTSLSVFAARSLSPVSPISHA